MKKTVLITGATSGIGAACARRFAQEDYRLILTGRRQELLEQLKAELTASFSSEILILCFDVRSAQEVEQQLSLLPDAWLTVDVLINNAGLAVGLEPIQQGLLDDWERMFDTNVKGLLYVSRQVAPRMISQGFGHIFNIGSIAGKQVYPNGAVYCASKHAVDALSQGLRADLLPYGIRVTQVCPGAVETEFSQVRFKGDSERATAVYKGFTPLSGADIADVIFYAASLPAHVNINDLVIMPTAQASATQFHKSL